jgi:PKD repeat protein
VYVSQITPGLAFSLERNTIQGNRKLSEGAGVYLGSLLACTVRDNAILDNVSSGNGAGIRFNYCTIEHNLIVGNQAALNGGGLYMAASSTDTLVRYNVIANNSAQRAGGGIWHAAYNNLKRYLINNSVLWNTSDTDGAGMNLLGTITVQDNTILYNTSNENNTGGVYVTNFPLFNRNNLYGNLPYGVSNGNDERTPDVNAENNYWGTADAALIPAQIWDEVDDRNLGTVDFNPYLASYNLDAPLAPVNGLAGSVGVTSVALTWSPNPEADVAGYKIYYDTDGPGYPYNGTGAAAGDSPIDVGKVTSYLLTGLPAGTYQVHVTAYDTLADGTRDQTEGYESWFDAGKAFTVGTPLVADFSASPTSGEAPLNVVFTNLSTGVFSACLWDFGDGATSTSCGNPAHTYAAAGVYTVSLKVTGLDSSNTKTRTAYITAVNPPPPVADFSGTPTSGDAALSVAFTNLSTGVFTACTWDFGDGATSTSCEDASHTYTTVGSFSVSLTVTGLGGSDTRTRSNYITTSLPPAPEAHFTASPVAGPAPLKVTFTNTSTGYFTECAWEFGDGGLSTVCNPIYTYQVEGMYAVKLTVTGLGGSSTLLITDYITVTEWVDPYPYKVAVPLVMR